MAAHKKMPNAFPEEPIKNPEFLLRIGISVSYDKYAEWSSKYLLSSGSGSSGR